MSNTQNRIRVACDLANQYGAPKNQLTLKTPVFSEARATRVDVGIMDNGLWQSQISFDSMTFELIAYSSIIGARLVSKTVNAPFNVVAQQAWDDVLDQHATFEMTASEMSVFSFGSTTPPTQALWMAITALSGSERTTLCAGAATAIRDGGVYSGASAPAAGDPAYLTGAETIAAIKAYAFPGRIVDGGYEAVAQIVDGELVWNIKAV